MGGWSDKTKFILISTLVEVVLEVEVEHIKNQKLQQQPQKQQINNNMNNNNNKSHIL